MLTRGDVDMPEGTTVSNNVERLRRASGLTQEAAAGRAGISVHGWRLVERGQRYGLPRTRRAMARALGVPLVLAFPDVLQEERPGA
jgi:transcriptional regulator with XRE-family HTH domain